MYVAGGKNPGGRGTDVMKLPWKLGYGRVYEAFFFLSSFGERCFLPPFLPSFQSYAAVFLLIYVLWEHCRHKKCSVSGEAQNEARRIT